MYKSSFKTLITDYGQTVEQLAKVSLYPYSGKAVETDYIYEAETACQSAPALIKLRENDLALYHRGKSCGLNSYIQECRKASLIDFIQASQVEVTVLSDQAFSKIKNDLGPPHYTVHKNRQIFKSPGDENIRACLDVFDNGKAYMEVQIQYATREAAAKTNARLMEHIALLNINAGDLVTLPYYKLAGNHPMPKQ
ncbi:MAG: hypothetical protein JWM96_850 [Alphaproteobacteria bacterium]|nr:hypothetical protein [Alphaproteobacteria bacterium]